MSNYIIIKIIGIIFIVSYLTTFLVKKIAKHVNAIDVPNKRSGHTLHNVPIPRMGGLGLFVSLLIGCVFFIDVNVEIVSILIGSFIIIVVGIIDDIKPVKAYYKLIMQIIGSLIVVLYGGIYFTNISFLGFTLIINKYIAQFLSVLFIVSITNAINLIDGLDGLATGIGLIYFLTIGVIGFILNKITGLDIKLILIMIGATLGFLLHNFPDAKIFLGDTGSMFLGFIIPVIALLGVKEGSLVSIVVPIIILGLPVLDTIFAILRRLVKKRKVTSADKEHFHHQILKLNFPLYTSVLMLYTVSLLFSFLAICYILRSLILFIILTIIILAILIITIFKSNILFDKKEKVKEKIKVKDKGKQNKKVKKV